MTGDLLRGFQHDIHVSDRQLAEVLATAREQGQLAVDAVTPMDPWHGIERGFDPLDECLRGCPATGWPVGYRGRRDAWLLILTRGLRMTRAQALAVSSSDLRSGWQVGDCTLGVDDDPRVCPRCIAARWLACRETEDTWSRSAVREQLVLAGAHRGVLEHECRQRGDVTTSLPAWLTLAPALDRHGWISSGHRQLNGGELAQRAMTPRALTQVLAWRCGGQTAIPVLGQQAVADEVDPVGAAPVGDNVVLHVFDDTTFDRLDAACERADEVNTRVEQLLSDLG